MISLTSWWWPKRPVRVPRARTAGLLAGLGALLFGVAAVLLKTGTTGWDESLFRLLNDVPAAATRVLTPLSRLVLPVGIAIVIVAIVGYVARDAAPPRSERPHRCHRSPTGPPTAPAATTCGSIAAAT